MIKTITDSMYVDATPLDRMENYIYDCYGNAVHDITLTGKVDNFSTSAIMGDCMNKIHQLTFTHGTNYVRFNLATSSEENILSYYSFTHKKHFIIDTVITDIFIQELRDESIIKYSSLEAHALTQHESFWEDSTIAQCAKDQYTLCVPVGIFANLLMDMNS